MLTKETVEIGDLVTAKKCYPRKARTRFGWTWDGKARKSAEPYGFEITGQVVGVRNVIMSNYQWGHPWEDEGNSIGWSTGTKEQVLLVAKSKFEEPVIVRFEDAAKVEPTN